jgi:uncharacterized membrane protein (UPF0136 family)
MTPGEIVLLAYAILMLLGGVMGYRAGSRASLIAGSVSGLVLLFAWWVAQHHLAVGLWIGVVIGLVLSVVFGRRYARTRKMMPSGMLLGFSLITVAVLLYAVLVPV